MDWRGRSIAEDHVPLYEVFEFANVAGPVRLVQHGHEFGGHGVGVAVVFAVVERDKIVDQIFEIDSALAQG